LVSPDGSGVFTSAVVVTGTTAAGATCEASDSVTVTRVEPVAPVEPVSCKDIKDLTGLSMVWDGPSGVNITTAAGEVFENVQNGNRISFAASKDVMGNDFEVYLTGAVNGTSKFHLSCSDDAMDGSEDCGSAQGDNKDDESSLVNKFLLDGMEGEKGSFACGLANTGEVAPTAGGNSGGTGGGSGDSVVLVKTEIDKKKLKLELENTSSDDLYITEVYVEWPLAAEELEKMKLDGDFAKNIGSKDGTTDLPVDKAFEKDDKDRKLKDGKKDKLEIEFKKDLEKEDLEVDDFMVIVKFSDGSEVRLNPNF
jgi:hypothetical protein